MKIKLDENVDLRILTRLRMAGHDVATVPGQRLISAPDTDVIEVCRQEGRCLVTADRDFSNRARFPPTRYSGIVVMRLPNSPSLSDWVQAIDTFIVGLEQFDVTGKLWIVQREIIHEYQVIDSKDEHNE